MCTSCRKRKTIAWVKCRLCCSEPVNDSNTPTWVNAVKSYLRNCGCERPQMVLCLVDGLLEKRYSAVKRELKWGKFAPGECTPSECTPSRVYAL